jgi:hypothetical protein
MSLNHATGVTHERETFEGGRACATRVSGAVGAQYGKSSTFQRLCRIVARWERTRPTEGPLLNRNRVHCKWVY